MPKYKKKPVVIEAVQYFEENLEEMNAAIEHVKTGQVTYAIKDTVYEGLEIKAGDYMGMFGKSIHVATPDKIDACCRLLKVR